MSQKTHLALLMMVKNESKRINVTLESVVGIVDSVVIFDTGSEDNTIEIITEFCLKHGLPLRLKEGVFEDFSTSRNISIRFAEEFEEIDWLLLLDCNDELQNAKDLHQRLDVLFHEPSQQNKTAFHVQQIWKSQTVDTYWNTRILRTKKGWAYKGSVHEYLSNDVEPELKVHRFQGPVLYQDRTLDDDKSFKRFSRDKILLEKDIAENPTDTRTMFYLAQTYSCLGEYSKAYDYYMKRSKYENYPEERFHAFYRAAMITQDVFKASWEKSMGLYLKAYEICDRAEPLIKIAEHYKDNKLWKLSYMYIKAACELDFPHKSILFVDKVDYDYKRWHILGIVSYYCKRYIEGRIGCLKALEQKVNVELDQQNLQFYENATDLKLTELDTEIFKTKSLIRKLDNTNHPIDFEKLNKKEFMKLKKIELLKQNPKLTEKTLQSKLNKLWKEYR